MHHQYNDEFVGGQSRLQDSPDLTPGAWWARKAGCTCGALDNLYGLGQPTADSDREFTIALDCPLHNVTLASPDAKP